MPGQYPTIRPQRALMFINKLDDTVKQPEFELLWCWAVEQYFGKQCSIKAE